MISEKSINTDETLSSNNYDEIVFKNKIPFNNIEELSKSINEGKYELWIKKAFALDILKMDRPIIYNIFFFSTFLNALLFISLSIEFSSFIYLLGIPAIYLSFFISSWTNKYRNICFFILSSFVLISFYSGSFILYHILLAIFFWAFFNNYIYMVSQESGKNFILKITNSSKEFTFGQLYINEDVYLYNKENKKIYSITFSDEDLDNSLDSVDDDAIAIQIIRLRAYKALLEQQYSSKTPINIMGITLIIYLLCVYFI